MRNYSIHKGFFPLTSRFDFNQYRKIRYESIQVEKFKKYLETEIQNSKNRKQGLVNALNFLGRLEPILNLNEILEEYLVKMVDEFNFTIAKLIKENRKKLLELQFQVDEVKEKMKVIGLKSTNVLSDTEFRYLKIILNKF